jgi:hypothetical protein
MIERYGQPPNLVAEARPQAAFDNVAEAWLLNLLLERQKEEQL